MNFRLNIDIGTWGYRVIKINMFFYFNISEAVDQGFNAAFAHKKFHSTLPHTRI